MTPTETRSRMSADQRREEILETAVADFAIAGLHGTSTEAIAQRAGISQPYLFRLFGTKKGLFIACIGRCFERTEGAFRAAAEADESGNPLEAMGQAYVAATPSHHPNLRWFSQALPAFLKHASAKPLSCEENCPLWQRRHGRANLSHAAR